jgi:hypothetical protein
MLPNVIAASPSNLDVLGELFDVDDPPAVRSYLGKHSFLVPLLVEVHQNVPRYFPDNTRLRLQLLTDRHGGDHVELFAIIESSLSEDQAQQLPDRFDEEWWLQAVNRASGRMTIDVEPTRTNGWR